MTFLCHSSFSSPSSPQFIRDFNFSSEIRSHLSQCAGTPLGPHDMGMNLSQTNFGEIGAKRPVDQWHIDSVPYVMVLLLSDARDMVGGKLQVARINGGDPSAAIDRINAEGGIDASEVDIVNYPGAGYCVFMQGSRIAHSVTAVQAAREPRLTCVNSYQSLNPFSLDRTKFVTFKTIEPASAAFEYARHVSWRVRGQLDYLMQHPDGFGKDDQLATLLDGAAAELAQARDMLAGRTIDELPYKPKATPNGADKRESNGADKGADKGQLTVESQGAGLVASPSAGKGVGKAVEGRAKL